MLWSLFDPLIFAHLFILGKILPGFVPKKSDLVVDVGSGDKPFWRADVCVDKLSLGNEQRFSASITLNSFGKFVDSDIEKMPFCDSAFDFSFCSHVLEHVTRPDLAIREIQRISRSGYIEVPHGFHEMLNPYHSHLWLVFLNENKLIFIRKSRRMHRILTEQSLKYRYLDKLLFIPFIRFYWNQEINFEIVNDLKSSELFETIKSGGEIQPSYVQNAHLIITRLFRWFFYQKKTKEIKYFNK